MSTIASIFQVLTAAAALGVVLYGANATLVNGEDSWYTRFNMRLGLFFVFLFQAASFVCIAGNV